MKFVAALVVVVAGWSHSGVDVVVAAEVVVDEGKNPDRFYFFPFASEAFVGSVALPPLSSLVPSPSAPPAFWRLLSTCLYRPLWQRFWNCFRFQVN